MVLLWPFATFAAQDTVTVHRCVDAKGHVTLQGDPCPAGSQGNTRQMQRPKDPPTGPPVVLAKAPEAAPLEPYYDEPAYEPIPPPVMFRCTSYDGIVRESENYDPNPRCEPLGLYYPQVTGQQATMCRWVEDSCLRLSDAAACAVWKKKLVEAKSKSLT